MSEFMTLLAVDGDRGVRAKVAEAPPRAWAARNAGTDEGCDAGEGVGEHPGDGDGGVGETGRAGEPVGGGDVGADRQAEMLGAPGAGRRGDDQDQAGGGDHLGQPEPGPGPRGRRCVTGGSPNIRLASTTPANPPNSWAAIDARPGCRSRRCPLKDGDDWVECRRDRLKRHDQHGQHSTGDDRVLQQLQPGVVRVRGVARRCRSRPPPQPAARCRPPRRAVDRPATGSDLRA